MLIENYFLLILFLTSIVLFLLFIAYSIGRINGKHDCLKHTCSKCKYWNMTIGKDYGLCKSPENKLYFDCESRTPKKYGCIFFRKRIQQL